MKTSTLVLSLAFACLAMTAVAAPTPVKDEIEVVASKYKNLFVFKVDRSLVGAAVEVYHSNGDLVATQTLSKRKMIIDFCDVKFGTYKIIVKKNNKEEEFVYVKSLVISQVIR